MSAQECARPHVPSGGAAGHIIDSVLVRSVAVIRFGSCEAHAALAGAGQVKDQHQLTFRGPEPREGEWSSHFPEHQKPLHETLRDDKSLNGKGRNNASPGLTV